MNTSKIKPALCCANALASDPSATALFASANITADNPKIADALHVVAREYGFETWPALKLHVEMASEDAVEVLITAIKANDASLVRQEHSPATRH